MRETELRKNQSCAVCKRPIGHAGLPTFYTLKIERHFVDMRAIQRQDGLAAVLGSPVLASVMGSDEDMTKKVLSVDITVCETCSVQGNAVAFLAELGVDHEETQ
jgi:hypothetical protein